MIPRIDVKSSVARKNFTGTLDFSFEAEKDLLDIPYVDFSAPVHVTLTYEIYGEDKVEAHARLTFSLKGLCSRCLAETEREIVSEAEGVFSPVPKDEEYGYQNVVDLREFLRDSVLFALPPRLLCEACAAENENE